VDRSGPLVAGLTLALVCVVGPWLDTRGEAAGVWTRRRWISLAAGVSVAYVFVRRPPPGARARGPGPRPRSHARGGARLARALPPPVPIRRIRSSIGRMIRRIDTRCPAPLEFWLDAGVIQRQNASFPSWTSPVRFRSPAPI
jgi:hypothetical protein